MYIGSRLGTGNYFDGAIDDVRLYDHVMSETEINQVYEESSNWEDWKFASRDNVFETFVWLYLRDPVT